MFKLSDHVFIIGGVLQEYSVRLDGLTGLVASSRHDAPPGTYGVYVLWEDSIYHDRVEELPKWVNVPPEYLRMMPDENESEDAPPAGSGPRGGLRLV